MPTFGRPQRLIENSIECFLRQNYADKFLLILNDDGREVDHLRPIDRVGMATSPTRFPSLPEKYDYMVELAKSAFSPHAYVVWDDDDVYLPHHLTAHAYALSQFAWSKPSKVWSTYTGHPNLELGAGRFHGSIAVWGHILQRVGGWRGVMPEGEAQRADFDQRMIQALAKNGVPGDPCEYYPSSYVFRWGDTGANHCQGKMRSPSDTSWYTDAKPQHAEPLDGVTPRLDASADRLFTTLAGSEFQAKHVGQLGRAAQS